MLPIKELQNLTQPEDLTDLTHGYTEDLSKEQAPDPSSAVPTTAPPRPLEELLKFQDKPPVLTREEAQAINELTKLLAQASVEIRKKINVVAEQIDTELSNSTNSNMTISYDTKEKPRLHEAIRHIFGYSNGALTYSMYQHALREKRKMEKDEAVDVFKKGD